MGIPRVSPFDPDRAGQARLEEFAALVLASRAVDWPDTPQHATAEMIIRRMCVPNPGEGERLRWAAYVGDRMAGFMVAVLPEDGHDGGVELTVHPQFRRLGAGTALLRTVLAVLGQRGRATIEGWWIAADGVGERWARRRGFRRTHATVIQNLSLPDADVSSAARTPAGYRIVEWVNHAPEELVVSYAAARRAIEDAPVGESSFAAPDWTVERIRRIEAEQRETGVEQHVVVAVHEATGEVVGFTEVELSPASEDVAHQYDTAVLAAHRGHGLGLHIKARMAERLRAERPEITRVTTSTGSDNTHMIRVNTALGYVVSHNLVVLTGEVDAISVDAVGE
ncbi:GNAT family N-acetyltransferase [Kutzneria buriramensis]|uniref:Acetyltransferase (GNAT) family protein n=1 Tax=Kutzneria buriramensis TaxID=1045776 RepID=A0A3E0H2E7_9PSEU|nr:GNAT family N-acetyltransferase [Kutzneria buriramensis]REH36200.1 acetyltransferase (GNAT) family protein [Kutzneria buriramensis]